jgi:hypothetical protein
VPLILDEHKRLLRLIAKAEATKDRADGYFDGWIFLSHSNLVEAMRSRGAGRLSSTLQKI